MTTAQINSIQNNKALNIGLWIAQVLLAAMFIMIGAMKSFTPLEELRASMPVAKDLPLLIRFIGAAELAGGLGLLLPSIFRIKPTLTPIAAFGLTTIMIFAMIYHIMHAEYSAIGINLIFALIAIFIAWGRLKKHQ